jgi:hypothetical protein
MATAREAGMAYRSEQLEALRDIAIGHGEATALDDTRAYYGECKLCPCPSFVGGQNEDFCGGCRHHKDDHRY